MTTAPPDVERARRTLWIIWGALFAALLVYAALPLLGVSAGKLSAPRLPLLMGGIAACQSLLVFVLRRRLLGGAQPAAALPAHVVIWSLCESIGLYGLVLGLLGYGSALLLGFIGAALVLLVLNAPRSHAV